MCLNAPKWDWSDQVMLLFGAWAGCYRDPRFTVRLRHRFFATKLPNQVRDRRGFEMRAFAYALLHFPSSLRLVLSHAFSFHVGNILFIIWCWWCLLTKMRKSACLNLFRFKFFGTIVRSTWFRTAERMFINLFTLQLKRVIKKFWVCSEIPLFKYR